MPRGKGKPAETPSSRSWSLSEREKVDEGVLALLGQKRHLPLLVLFRDQADSQWAYEAAVKAVLPGNGILSAREISVAGRSGVVQALQTVAAQSQAAVAPLLKQLRTAGQSGKARHFFAVNAMALTVTEKGLLTLAQQPEVARILPNRWITLTPPVDGPLQPLAGPEWNLSRIGTPEVWNLGFDGTGVTVGSIDTGVEYGHPALERKFRGYDPANPAAPNVTGNWYDAVGGQNGLPYDDNRHGTHVTGIMVGSDPAGLNQIGVAPGARWIAAKGFNARGQAQTSWLLDAGQWMLAPLDPSGQPHPEWAPDVLNNSWGGGAGIDEWYRPLITNWRNAGIMPVVAAGNAGPGAGSVSIPGNYPESITVGATDSADGLAAFSGRGPSPYGEIKPEISAPGVNIRSSVPGQGYSVLSGTSMATPHISGVAALMLSAQPALTVDQLESALVGTAVRLTSAEYPESPNNGYGHGLVSAFEAVGAVTRGHGTIAGRVMGPGSDSQAPVITHSPVTSAFALVDLPLDGLVTDEVGVALVQILARRTGEEQEALYPMERVEGDHLSGRYRGLIPAAMVLRPSLEYRIRAVDGSGTESFHGPHLVQIQQGIGPGYRQDFEQAPDGFVAGGTTAVWEWGEPVYPQPRSGRRIYGTGLDGGTYPPGIDGWLQLPPVDLRGVSQARLHLWQWLDTQDVRDYAEVLLSADGGGHWTSLVRQSGSVAAWEQLQIDLTPYAGQSLLVRLNLHTDGVINRRGWFIDDLALLGPDTTAPGAPGNLAAQPTQVGSILLTWAAPGDEDIARYRIQRASGAGGSFETIGESTALTYYDSAAPGGLASTYRVLAVDFWGNISQPSVTATATPIPVRQLFRDDFESTPSTWTAQGILWEHGIPTTGPRGAFSGQRLWATRLGGNYVDNQVGTLTSPAVSLAGLTTAALQFAHWYHTEANYDFADVEVSVDEGLHWTLLGRYTGLGRSWRQPVLSLTPYVGQSVRIRFRFTSDPSNSYPGWYLDDVLIAGMPAAAPRAAEEAPAAIPLAATVTVAETGRSVATDPSTGSYSLAHLAGEWTVRAEAAGMAPAERRVQLGADQTLQVDFTLAPPEQQGRVEGIVRHAETGDPVAGVALSVVEEPALSASTGTDGRFGLDLAPGAYTLRLEAPFFFPLAVPVVIQSGGETLWVEPAIRPFTAGAEALLAYDDGGFENADAWSSDGSGWAVRMSPPAEGALLARAEFLLMDTSWPVPGGDLFALAVYDSDGPNGGPGRLLVEPRQVTGLRNGSWTEAELSGLGLVLQRDFYLAYIQQGGYPGVPALTTDTTAPYRERTWERDGGTWQPAAAQGGNRMIRAVLLLKAEPAPALELVVTEPAENAWTTRETITVRGQVSGGVAPLTLTANGQPVPVQADGSFVHRLPLQPGANQVAVVARDDAGLEVSITRAVTVDWPPLRLFNLTPCTDQLLRPDRPFTTGFDGEPGCTAKWTLLLFGDGEQMLSGPMAEVYPGRYEGTCTPPAGLAARTAMLLLHLDDGRGGSGAALLPARLIPS